MLSSFYKRSASVFESFAELFAGLNLGLSLVRQIFLFVSAGISFLAKRSQKVLVWRRNAMQVLNKQQLPSLAQDLSQNIRWQSCFCTAGSLGNLKRAFPFPVQL